MKQKYYEGIDTIHKRSDDIIMNSADEDFPIDFWSDYVDT